MNENDIMQLILNKFDGLENNINNNNNNINNLQTNIKDINNNINNLQTNIKDNNNNINNLQTKFNNLQEQTDILANEVRKTKIILENDINKKLDILLENHIDTHKKLINHEERIKKLEKKAV